MTDLPEMTDAPARPVEAPCEPDIDENGVDLAQIRAMLDLPPAERLARVTEFTVSLRAARVEDGGSGSD